jgi:tetratricopeptide (TPR) repeat protein
MRLIAVCALLVFSAVHGPAIAVEERTWSECMQPAWSDKRAAACTEVASDRGESKPRRAAAYHSRGIVYQFLKQDLDRAIADYTRAIKLVPEQAAFYFSRAISYGRKGDITRSIADHTTAIRLAPREPSSYYYRGLIYLNTGNRARAIVDLKKASGLGAKQAESELKKLGVTP